MSLNTISNNLLSFLSEEKYRDALRLGLQSALSAAVTYYTIKYFSLPEAFVGILSSVLVIDSSVGHTMEKAKQRLTSTLIGSVIGFASVWALPSGWSTMVSLLITMFIINGLASIHSEWRYGVVAAVALSLRSEENAMDTTLDRLLSIGIGAAIGIVISLIVWPDTAEKRTKKFAKRALSAAVDKFKLVYKNANQKEKDSTEKSVDAFHKNLNLAKSSATSIKFANSEAYQNRVDRIEKLYNSILIIDRVAAKSDDQISSDSGIKEDAEEIKEKACEIMECLVSAEDVDKDKLEAFDQELEDVKNNVNVSEDSRVNTIRQSFVFGLTELGESLDKLVESFKEGLDDS